MKASVMFLACVLSASACGGDDGPTTYAEVGDDTTKPGKNARDGGTRGDAGNDDAGKHEGTGSNTRDGGRSGDAAAGTHDAACSDSDCAPPPSCDGDACALSDLIPSVSALQPAFDPTITEYTLDLGIEPATFTITPVAADGAEIVIAGSPVDSGSASPAIDSPDFGESDDVEVLVTLAGKETRYVLHVRRFWRAALHAKSSNPDVDDRFGSSVAASGDLVVVGAPAESSDATGVDGDESSNATTGSGAAYVFRKTSDGWLQEAYLKASNPDADDAFGTSVAISGDVVVVGAPQESSNAALVDGDDSDDSLLSAGAAYVFRRVAGSWQQEAYLKASSPSEGDWFGVSVSITDDVIVVGADQEDGDAVLIDGATNEAAPGSGAAYVYRYASSSWHYEAYLKASNTGAGDAFGHRVAAAGNMIAISAPGEDSDDQLVGGTGANDNANDSGAVYVYRYSAGSWQHEAYLKASNTDAGDDFGSGLALADATLVVGADQEDSAADSVGGDEMDESASASGAAYVYRYASGSWMHVAYLKPGNPGPDDRFGVAVATNGSDMIAVGAHDEDGATPGINPVATEGAQHAGAVYVFRDSGSGFAQEAYLKGSDASLVYGRFGWSIAYSDGVLAIGARDDAGGGMGIEPESGETPIAASGALYVFE